MRAALVLMALGGLVAAAAQGSAGELRVCGGYASSDGMEVQRSKNRCLTEAFRKGGPATLVVRRGDRNGEVSTENIFRVLGVRRLELFVDVKRDRLGAQRWHRFICRELAVRGRFLAPRRCAETPLTATGSRSTRQVRCGRFARRRIEPMITSEEREGYGCLAAAFERGAPAMLVVTGPTIEGDPLTVYYAVLGPGRAERLVDATRDRYSIPQWHRFLCGAVSLNARGTLDFRDCRETRLPRSFPRR